MPCTPSPDGRGRSRQEDGRGRQVPSAFVLHHVVHSTLPRVDPHACGQRAVIQTHNYTTRASPHSNKKKKKKRKRQGGAGNRRWTRPCLHIPSPEMDSEDPEVATLSPRCLFTADHPAWVGPQTGLRFQPKMLVRMCLWRRLGENLLDDSDHQAWRPKDCHKPQAGKDAEAWRRSSPGRKARGAYIC